jgi:hypothetical protein
MMARHGWQWHGDDQEDLHVLYEDNCRFFSNHQRRLVGKAFLQRAIWGELNKTEIAGLGAVSRVGEISR